MRATVLKFGLLSGVIVAGLMTLNVSLVSSAAIGFDTAEVTGYGTMLVALSLVFFGIKSFRDSHQGGTITFGRAFAIGILITSLASLMYVLSWEITYQSSQEIRETFMDRYADHTIAKLKAEGASEETIVSTRESLENMKAMYATPVFRMAMTLVEIFPVGLIITLISAAILRKKEVLPPAP